VCGKGILNIEGSQMNMANWLPRLENIFGLIKRGIDAGTIDADDPVEETHENDIWKLKVGEQTIKASPCTFTQNGEATGEQCGDWNAAGGTF
jgi:hypothetical protein